MEEKWKVMKSALVETATEILGKVRGSQPDWFRESEEVIIPYIKSMNTLYLRPVRTSTLMRIQTGFVTSALHMIL